MGYAKGVRGVGAGIYGNRKGCPTLCDPIDGSPPGSPVPGILQAQGLFCLVVHGPLIAMVPLVAEPGL